MNFAYLIFNVFIFISPLIGIRLYKKAVTPNLYSAAMGILIPGLFFVMWDILVNEYFWSFNSKYVLGIIMFGLPIEEILFFLVVPFSMLVLWENYMNLMKSKDSGYNSGLLWYLGCAVVFGLVYSLSRSWWYSSAVFVSLLLAFLMDYILNLKMFLNKFFLVFLAITSVFVIVFNNYLTSLPIVVYSESVKSNILIGTMPVEDILYGISLIYLNILVYEYFQRNKRPHYSFSQ